jgi:hypothetical protein
MTKRTFLIAVLFVLAVVGGYDIGYYTAPQYPPPVQLVMPPHWVPDKQPTTQRL